MPPAIIAVAVAVGYAAIQGSTLALVGAILSAALSIASQMLTPKPKSQQRSAQQGQQERQQSFKNANAPRVVVYGRTVVGGVVTYATSSGASNQYMHVIVALTGHEVEAITDIQLNDTWILDSQINAATGNVTAGDFAGYVRVKRYTGAAGQLADADLMAEAPAGEWTAAHRGRGVAYVYVRMLASADKFPGGFQNLRAMVKGKKVYDPRTGQSAYSDNAALCVLDYLTSPLYGLGASSAEWDPAWWIAQANICEEDVAISAGVFQDRYTINGSFSTEDIPANIVDALLQSCQGAIVYQQGQYKLHAAAYVAPTRTLTAKDLRGEVEVMPRAARRELFNAVRGSYFSEKNNWQTTDFPPVTNATYETQDGGFRVVRELELAFVNEELRAQRLAKIMLEAGRQAVTCRFPAKMTLLDVAGLDTVAVTLTDFGWSAKVFRVLDWTMTEDGGIDLMLREEAATQYDWAFGEATTSDPAPDTGLHSPFDPPDAPEGVGLASGDAELDVRLDGTVLTRLKVSWTAIADVFVEVGGKFEVMFRPAGTTDWLPGATASGASTFAYLNDVNDGAVYDVRVRALNSLNVPSAWTEVDGYEVLGKLAPPSEPDSFLVSSLTDGTRRFEWTHVDVPADVRAGGGYLIRFVSGASSDWTSMTPLHDGVLTSSPFETTLLSGGTYSFGIKSVDSSGNESTLALYASAVALDDPPMAGALYSADERGTGWLGTKTNCFNDGGVLRATSTAGWSSLPATWAALSDKWDTLLPQNTSMDYVTLTIDLGADVYAKPIVKALGNGAITATMKAWLSGASEPGGFSALAGATGRYWKIKVAVTDGSAPRLDSLFVVLDAPSVSDIFTDLNTGSAANSTSFYKIAAGNFLLGTRVGLATISLARINALQSVGGAWTWELVSKNATIAGTTISPGPAAEFKVRNAAGTLADAVIDAELRGPRG